VCLESDGIPSVLLISASGFNAMSSSHENAGQAFPRSITTKKYRAGYERVQSEVKWWCMGVPISSLRQQPQRSKANLNDGSRKVQVFAVSIGQIVMGNMRLFWGREKIRQKFPKRGLFKSLERGQSEGPYQPRFYAAQLLWGQSNLESSQPIKHPRRFQQSSKCNFFQGSLPSHLIKLLLHRKQQFTKLFNVPSLIFDITVPLRVILVGYSVAAIIGN